jgi:alkylhydroperoxidase family enzyme
MSTVRIPYRSANVLPAGIPPLNLFRLWAHSPSTLPHSISLGTACFRDTSLPPHHRELLCLLNAKRLSCDYQWKQHVPIARSVGISESQIAALEAGQIGSSVWSAEEKALLAFIDEVIANPEVTDSVFNEARRFLSDQALVEVVTMQVRGVQL